MSEFNARLTGVRVTPSRSEDNETVCRILLEAHDLEVDWLVRLTGKTVDVSIVAGPGPRLPLDDALESVTSNGRVEDGVPVSAGRRRRGTKATPTEDE